MRINWKATRDYVYIFVGALLQAFAMRLFLIPATLASGGVSGISQLINHFTGWPIGNAHEALGEGFQPWKDG